MADGITLQEFVEKWNAEKHAIVYMLVQNDGALYPSSIEARFPIRPGYYTHDWFMSLVVRIEIRSQATLFVTTDSYLFARGILDLKVSTKQVRGLPGLLCSVLESLEEEIKL